MKHLYLTLTFLLPWFGSTVVAQSGMTVFGDCYVADSASIGFLGEELILEADVVGEGSLLMAGKTPQRITSQNRSIDHLVVVNSTRVQLNGILTVRKSLDVRRGTLEVLPLSKLRVSPGAIITLSPGGKLLQNHLVWQPGADEALPGKHTADSSDLCLIGLPAGWDFSFRTLRTLQGDGVPKAYQTPDLKALLTPPWRA